MAFDWEVFAKQGLMPFFGGGMGDIISANLQSRLARQRHQQEMEQLTEMYKLRGAEQEKGQQNTLEELAERKKMAEVEDVMERGRIVLKFKYNVKEARETAHIHNKSYAYTEGLRHQNAMAEEQFRQFGDKHPDKINEIVSNTILRSQQARSLLDESDAEVNDQIMKLSSIVNQDEAGAEEYRYTPAEKEAASRTLRMLESRQKRNADWRQTIDNQMKSFAQNGATDAGIVPEDRVSFLKNMMRALEDKMNYHGKTISDIPAQELPMALQQHAIESGLEEGLTAADFKFILANIGRDLKATFLKPKK